MSASYGKLPYVVFIERKEDKMSLNKAIASGKEHRKQYRGAKAVDCTCRNHGDCDWCKENRLYKYLKRLDKANYIE